MPCTPAHSHGWPPRLRPAASQVCLCVGLVAALPLAARADQAEERGHGVPSPSIATSLPDQGDPYGVRRWLSEQGINYGLVYKGEVLGNPSGGIRRGAIYEDRFETYTTADFEKLIGWRGLSFYSNQFWIHATGNLSREFVGNLVAISNIEALPSNRLSELWLEQKFLGDKASIRVGQLTADDNFYIARYSELFINSDWPAITKHDLPSGGPAYPLSTPGVRLAVEPARDLLFQVAIFNGDPAGPGPADPEVKNRHGLNFRLRDPPFLISEVAYAYNQEKSATGLAGDIKLGAWHHFGRFDDQRFDPQRLSLADISSTGIAARLRGNNGIYGIIDQQIWRPAGGGADSGAAVFSRVSASPSDRNLINFYLDGGITFAGLVPNRPDDKFGATFIYAKISDSARALDLDRIFFTGQPQPVRDYELALNLTYQAQIRPGWSIQPDLQYIIHPGGHAPDPNNPSAPIRNAIVFGARTTIVY